MCCTQVFTEKWELYTKSEISTAVATPVQEQVSETPEEVAVAKPMPRVTPSPKSEIKRKRSEDLDGAAKDQKHQKLARFYER